MPDQKYWVGRFEQIEQFNHDNAWKLDETIGNAYREAQKEVERDMSTWYQRFATNNNISLREAKQMLSTSELKEFKWSVDEYIKRGRESAVDGRWIKELENASTRFHVTRLQALQLEIQNTVEVLYGNQTDSLDAHIKQTYLDTYNHTAFEIQKGVGIGWDIAGVNQRTLQTIVNTPWTPDGHNFSERIWTNKTALISELQKQLTQNLMLGISPDASVQAIAKKFNTTRSNAGRLVYTETAFFQAVSQGDCYHALDVQKFQFIATLDDVTSEVCRALDGEIFDMKDYQPGVTVPPLHPWCRSCTAPYYEDLAGIGERAARDPATGSTYHVPRDMTYREWEKTFVNGGSKDGLNEAQTSSYPFNYSCDLAAKFGKGYYDQLHRIVTDCSNEDLKKVWKRYEEDIGVGDADYQGHAHCRGNTIYVNGQNDTKGSSWEAPYATTFHESGHAIDNLCRNDSQYRCVYHYSSGYKNGLFPQTIKDEVRSMVSAKDVVMKAEFKAHAKDYQWLQEHNYISKSTYEFYQNYGTWLGGRPSYSKSMAYKAVEREV